jgi:glycosyltransferase involved in cell wall biosynthesis
MKSDKVLLSILMPTYNRSYLLKSSIEKLEEMGYFSCNQIEVIVSDNCSSDNTLEYLNHKNINYLSQKRNLGYAGNLMKLLEAASGKYTWIIGDDDLALFTAEELLSLLINKDDCEFYVFGEEFNVFSSPSLNLENIDRVLSMPFGFISNVIQKNSIQFNDLCKRYIGNGSHDSPHFFARWIIWHSCPSNGVYSEKNIVESLPVKTSRLLNYQDLLTLGRYDRSFNWYSAYIESKKIPELMNFLPEIIKIIIRNNLVSGYKKRPIQFIVYWIMRLYHGIFIKKNYSIFMAHEIKSVIKINFNGK